MGKCRLKYQLLAGWNRAGRKRLAEKRVRALESYRGSLRGDNYWCTLEQVPHQKIDRYSQYA